jgi:TolB protein
VVAEDRGPGYPGRPTLYLITSDGNAQPITLGDKWVYGITWSPDGNDLVYSAIPSNEYAATLFRVGWNDLLPRKIDIGLTGGADRSQPAWSPTDNRLAFTQIGNVKPLIHTVGTDGTDPTFLVEGYNPFWAPDGKSIGFSQAVPEVGPGFSKLRILDLESGDIETIAEGPFISSPSWSPTGEYIAFSGDLGDGAGWGVYVIDPMGNQTTRLSDFGEYPTWLPDGQALLVGHKGRLYLMNLDGTVEDLSDDLPPDLYYLYAAVPPSS